MLKIQETKKMKQIVRSSLAVGIYGEEKRLGDTEVYREVDEGSNQAGQPRSGRANSRVSGKLSNIDRQWLVLK